MKDLSATYKGLITGALMIIIAIIIFFTKGNIDNPLIYLVYGTYIAGIIWTLLLFKKSPAENKSFKYFFSEGFRCFIVSTLLIVIFTWIYYRYNTTFRDEMLRNLRTDLVDQKNYTITEIEDKVSQAKKMFLTIRTFIAILGYLVIGSLTTVIGAAFLSQQKK
jgi:hypothetical protein